MMEKSRIVQQFSDFFSYLLIPGLAIIMPAGWSRWMVKKVSGWDWYMAAAAEAAWSAAKEFVDINNDAEFKQRYKQVELLDVRDLYLMLCGRERAVMAEIQMAATQKEVPLDLVKDRVLIGMHWGPSISILKKLQLAGMQPAFPYRPLERAVLRIRPFFYFFSSMAGRYLASTMGDRAIPIGGAGKVLRRLVDQPGSIVVLMDAPPMEGRPVVTCDVLGKPASFNVGFAQTLAETGKEYVFYAMSLESGEGSRKRLELDGPHCSSDEQEFMQRYAGFLSQNLGRDPAQWRIWHAAGQFWHKEQ